MIMCARTENALEVGLGAQSRWTKKVTDRLVQTS